MLRLGAKSLAIVLASALLAFAAAVAWPTSSAPLPDPRRGYVIEGVRVIDVETGVAGSPVAVVVREGVIASIGPVVANHALVRVDGNGRWLVPGFWDMHMHSYQQSPRSDFPLFVANGVTSVRDMMDCPDPSDALIACMADKRRWNAEARLGRMTSPRFVEVASYYLNDPALTLAEVSARAVAYKARGVSALKVYDRLSRPAYFHAAAQAKVRRMRLVGHLPKAVALNEAVSAGQSSFEHAHILPRHCFARAAEWRVGKLDTLPPTSLAEALVAEHDPAICQHAFATLREAVASLVPTHVTREDDARADDPTFVEKSRLDYLDPLSRWANRDDLAAVVAQHPGARGRNALAAYFEHGLRLTGEAHRAGVRVLVGTDTAVGGLRYHDELAHLARAGLSPAEVLRAATIEAARYAGLETSSGSVAVGKRADLVLLDADPLVDVGNARRIRAVFLNGRLYDRRMLDGLLAFVRGQASAPHNWAKLLWGFAWSSVSSDL